jgi:hypothetical protein
MRRNRFESFARQWGWPLAVGLLCTSGLLSALVSEHWGDVWAWIALAVPLLVVLHFARRH